MCIAILNTPNVTFPKSIIRNCWENNSDGAGLIWTNTKNKTLHTYKELDNVNAFYDKYLSIRRKHPKSNVVLHFRISTSGGVNLPNTHPFSVTDKLAFVHNGVISELNGIDKQRSDTNLFNARVLQNLPAGFERNQAIADLIAKYIGHSKLIFLNAQNEYTIINPSLGKTDETYKGCWFSNSTYKPSAFYDYGGKQVAKAGYKSAALPVQSATPWKQTTPVQAFPETIPAPEGTSKVWQKGYQWSNALQLWEAPKQVAVKQWDASAQDWKQDNADAWKQWNGHETDLDTLSDNAWIEYQTLSTAERKDLHTLRAKPIAEMTAEQWARLQDLEYILDEANGLY
jgi:predicted glutamine amidotransferase